MSEDQATYQSTPTAAGPGHTIQKSVGWSEYSPVAMAGLSGIPKAELHQHSELTVDGQTYRRRGNGDWVGPRSDGSEHPEFASRDAREQVLGSFASVGYQLIHPELVTLVNQLRRIAQKAEDRGLFRASDDEGLRSELDHLVTDVQCACGMEAQ